MFQMCDVIITWTWKNGKNVLMRYAEAVTFCFYVSANQGIESTCVAGSQRLARNFDIVRVISEREWHKFHTFH